MEKAIKEGPYGLCVYNGNNNVIDNQIVNIEFEGGSTASLTMTAFTELLGERQTRIHGTKGEIIGDMTSFTHYKFSNRRRVKYNPVADNPSGHGGGDYGMVETFVKALNAKDQSVLGCWPEDVLESHLLVFAAEESRRTGATVDVAAFRRACGADVLYTASSGRRVDILRPNI